MPQVSSAVTGAATITVVQLADLVQWGLNGFPHPVPESVPGVIAAMLFMSAHALFNYVQTRTGGNTEPPTGEP